MSDWYRRLWAQDKRVGLGYRTLSALLTPAEGAYRLAVSARAWAYDRGLLNSEVGAIPTLTVGNLTVGGTGKTPVTAWFARALVARGLKPAVVMRGYGGDEVGVHRVLNPEVPVVVAAKRVAGVERAGTAGSDVAVLDDAYQHRAIRPDACVVLVAAEDFVETPRLLPRGPWREPLEALNRATLVVATRKMAREDDSLRVVEQLARMAPALPSARAHIRLSGLARYKDESLDDPVPLAGFRCAVAVAGVARPDAVWHQLRSAGADVDVTRAYPDHHRYSRRDVEEIRRLAYDGPVVATLKDVVKLGAALSGVDVYVPLQEVVWESGADEVERLLAGLTDRASSTIGTER
jgi:tetraacyldisaccharide 4'-kinase